MNTSNERIRQLRKTLNLTQSEFGSILGITTSGVSDIESGRRNVTEQHLIMLFNWKEHKINTGWIRTGEGEMFIELPEEDEVAAYVSDLLEDDGENQLYALIKEIMHTYSELSPKSKEVLCEFSGKLIDNLKRKES